MLRATFKHNSGHKTCSFSWPRQNNLRKGGQPKFKILVRWQKLHCSISNSFKDWSITLNNYNHNYGVNFLAIRGEVKLGETKPLWNMVFLGEFICLRLGKKIYSQKRKWQVLKMIFRLLSPEAIFCWFELVW
jgi:hypothetical protein